MPALEALGGVSAVFATVSIALQLADAAVQLHAFWQSFRGCPKEMRDLLSDLLLLQTVLKDIHAEETLLPVPHEALPTHEPLLKCEQYFGELEALARKLQVDISKGKVQRTWKSVKVVFQKDDLGKFKDNLESMKITLVLARQSLASMLSMHQNRIFASSINSFSVRQLETAKALRAMEGQLQQDTSVIINALQATSNTVIPKPIICTLESTIKSYVKEGFKESFQELQARLEEQHRTSLEPPLQEMHDVEAESRGFDLSSPNKTDPVPVIQDQNSSLDNGEEMQRSSVQYEQFKNHKAYDTLFGRIGVSIRAALKITKVVGFGVEKDNSERIFNASFTFKPCSWLSRPAVWNLTVQQKSSSIGHNLNIQPTYSPIVSHKSPIFQSCREGDLLKVIEILRTGQASVHDIDEWGRGLMHMAAKSQNIALIKRLVCEGCIKGSVDEFGNSALDMVTFFRKHSNNTSSPLIVPESQFADIVRILIEEADCDPNFEYFENRCSNNLLQNLCKYRRVLDLRELTPIIHYLLTQESFSMEPSPTIASQIREFSPMSDMLYHSESEVSADMANLVQKQKISATFVAEFGFSVLQDALMQDHNIPIIRSLILSGAWLHTKDADRRTPTRIAWWRSNSGEYHLPFASYNTSTPPTPPEADNEIFDFLLEDGNFSRALQECDINLWEFASNEARVLASEDTDEPLQYLTGACYHRKCVDGPGNSPAAVNAAPTPFRRRSHVSEDP